MSLVGACGAYGPWLPMLAEAPTCQRIGAHAIHRWVGALEDSTGATVTITWTRALMQAPLPLTTVSLRSQPERAQRVQPW